MDALLKAPVAESPFVQMAKTGRAGVFRKQLEELEKTQIRPAIQRYRDFLRRRISPRRARRSASPPIRTARPATPRP